MDIINNLAHDLLGISGSQLIVMGGLAVALVIVWVLIRTVLKIAFRVFALGCVTILGAVLGLYILFAILR